MPAKKYSTDAERREAHRLSESRRRKRSPERVREQCRRADALRWSNPSPEVRARHNEASRRFREKNPEKARKYIQNWQKANPEKVRFYSHCRRARKAGAPGRCSVEQVRARVEFYGRRCWVPGCGKTYEAIDHVIPLSKGGSNWPANLRPICKRHNSQKKDSAPAAFIARMM